jgi:NAD(P)-dependent dehydrogenase (short-subunit alcohol dehydrogenase family)
LFLPSYTTSFSALPKTSINGKWRVPVMKTVFLSSGKQQDCMSKTVIITGASGNLGTAVTKHFLQEGYTVAATVFSEASRNDLPQSDRLQVTAVNLASEDEATAFVQKAISTYTRIEAALLLVGGFAMGDVEATKGSDLQKQFSLNFETAYYTARPLFQHMKKNGYGRIVFIGARPALQPAAGKKMLAYALSKSLLFKLSDYLNEEAKGTNVTTTVVVPSTIDTPPNRQSMPDANPEDWVKPEALAEILSFVVSDKSAPLREAVIKVYNNA